MQPEDRIERRPVAGKWATEGRRLAVQLYKGGAAEAGMERNASPVLATHLVRR